MPEDSSIQRVRNACEACHERKIKCKPSPTGGVCQTCATTGRNCFFLPRIKAGRPRRKRSPPPTSQDAPTSLPSPTDSSSIDDYTGLDEGTGGFSNDMDTFMSTDFSWSQFQCLNNSNKADLSPQFGQLSPFTENNEYMFDTNGGAAFDVRPSLQHLPIPSLSSDGSRTSASSSGSFRSPASSILAPSNMPSPISSNLNDSSNSFFHSMSHLSHSPLQYIKDDPVTQNDTESNEPGPPSFHDLLVKCSEVERLLESLSSPSLLGLNLDTSTPASSLHKMLQAIDSAGEAVLTAASFLSFTRNRMTAMPTPPYDSRVDSINPAVLTKGCQQNETFISSQNLALHALAMALSLRILDVCEVLVSVQPSNNRSHHHILYLKRLDVNLVQVSSALNQLNDTKDISHDPSSQRARHRAAEIHARIKSAMEAGW